MKEPSIMVILGLVFAAASPGGSAQLDLFSGYWINVDPDAIGVTALEIGVTGPEVKVGAWGRCHPEECYWGSANSSIAYGPRIDSDLASEATALSAIWRSSFGETLMVILPSEPDQIRADVYTRFPDGSGRSAYAESFLFERREGDRCFQDLPDPQIELTGIESYTVSGKNFTRYNLAVANWNAYPPEIFEAAPDLPPCGLNPQSSRTWVEIRDQNGGRIYGFCALNHPMNLTGLWFSVEEGEGPPESAYMVMMDRRCERSLRSNEVSIDDLSTPTTSVEPTDSKAALPANLQAMMNFQMFFPL